MGELTTDGKIIIKESTNIIFEGVYLLHVIHKRAQWRAFAKVCNGKVPLSLNSVKFNADVVKSECINRRISVFGN